MSPRGRARALLLAAAFAAIGILVNAGCARSGVPVESRPTPPQPASPTSTEVPATSETAKASQTPPSTVDARVTRIAADTTAVSSALRKCSGRKLLPDQEGVYESTQRLLVEARAAMTRDDWRAPSRRRDRRGSSRAR